MIISTIAHWYGAARSALRAMLFGSPAPPLPSPMPAPTTPLEPWPLAATFSTAPVLTDEAGDPEPLVLAMTEELPELTTCQGPESTPGSFNWMRSHNFAATDRDLKCADCGMRWPEAPQKSPA
jgi:hypothetical protein